MGLTLRDLYPPVLAKVARATFLRPPRDALFGGDDEMFKRAVVPAKTYGEYGMGASTRWVLGHTKAIVRAVDTSELWVNHVKELHGDNARLEAKWVNLGDVGEWGRPIDYSLRSEIPTYLDGIWGGDSKPEVVLIDGRFRVACFFHSLLSAEPGTKILFDDYLNRPQYHVVEECLQRSEICGRQALFIVPEKFDQDRVADLRERFQYVMD